VVRLAQSQRSLLSVNPPLDRLPHPRVHLVRLLSDSQPSDSPGSASKLSSRARLANQANQANQHLVRPQLLKVLSAPNQHSLHSDSQLLAKLLNRSQHLVSPHLDRQLSQA
jgi:hypothetical protein